MLCYLRYPGRPLHADEQPAAAVVAFVADQIDVIPEAIHAYLGSEQNRRRHAVELQDQLGLRPFGTRPAAELASWLLPHAIENDQLAHLTKLVLEECRRRRIIIPRPQRLERLCIEVRHQARREVQRRLTDGLSADQRQRLDALPGRRKEAHQTWLTWLRQMPEAAKPGAMLGLIERPDHVRAIGLDPARGHRVHQARLAQLAREATSADIARHLACHGINAETARTVMAGISASDVLLSYASDITADLLVVGGYGHSRLRELVLGGVTRELLRHMTLPVLMSH
jgi:nucleotide-binding universal stress UspA family protein